MEKYSNAINWGKITPFKTTDWNWNANTINKLLKSSKSSMKHK